MKKLILATAAIVAVSGGAFAGSDNFGSNGASQPAAAVDSNSYTASIRNSASAQNPVPADEKPVNGSDRNLFGNN